MVKSFPIPASHVENSFELVNTLRDVVLDEGHKLISLDVISLFTNIPIDLAIDSVSNKWTYLEGNTDLSKSEFINAFVLFWTPHIFLSIRPYTGNRLAHQWALLSLPS